MPVGSPDLNQPGYIIGHGYYADGLSISFKDQYNSIQFGSKLLCDNGYQPSQLLNQWVFVGFVFDRNSAKIFAYINGLKQSGSIDISNVRGDVLRSDGAIYLSNVWGWVIDGIIDEVRVYNRALSDIEIKALYDATK